MARPSDWSGSIRGSLRAAVCSYHALLLPGVQLLVAAAQPLANNIAVVLPQCRCRHQRRHAIADAERCGGVGQFTRDGMGYALQEIALVQMWRLHDFAGIVECAPRELRGLTRIHNLCPGMRSDPAFE